MVSAPTPLQGRPQGFVDRDGIELIAELIAHDPNISLWRWNGRAPVLWLRERRQARPVAGVVAVGSADDSHMRHRRAEFTRRVLGQTVKVPEGSASPERPCRRHPAARSLIAVHRPSLRAFHGAYFRRARRRDRGPYQRGAQTFTDGRRAAPRPRRRQFPDGPPGARGPDRSAPSPPAPPVRPHTPSRPTIRG